MVRVQCIQDVSQFPPLADAWDRLVLAAPQPSPMLLSGWILAWMEVFGADVSPMILTAWEGDRLVGGLPLCHARRRLGPVPVYEEVRFLGIKGVGGMYMDMLLAPDAAPRAAQALLLALNDTVPWDRLRLERMLPQASLHSALRQQGTWPGTLIETHSGVASPVLPLPDTMDALIAGMDPVFRSMLFRKNLKMAPRLHAVEFIPVIAREDIDRDLDRLIEVHTRRWNLQGRRGEFARADVRDFYHLLSHRLAEKGMLRISKLLLDGEAHSFEYGVQIGRQYFALHAGISPEGLECQAGTYHLYHILEGLLPHASHYHFMEGGEPYKYRWGAVHQAVQDAHVWCGFKGRVLHRLRRLNARLRSANPLAATTAGAGMVGWMENLPSLIPSLARTAETTLPLLDAAF
ncbi:GNAT family N-acetyltransferase [Megalodesulfovibrio gigas]|uniref:GNAT family N-acetyltransferase n=1 Tax=Megalodesulfovibrio gigas TaxID=879 RepID=UPI000418CD1A|nr:GNAT family N-acetyltransferase [Megalodesulfovibrio gigas]